MSEKRKPKYLTNVIDTFASGEIPAEPGVVHVTILHDPWCALLAGKGDCDCEPVIATPKEKTS